MKTTIGLTLALLISCTAGLAAGPEVPPRTSGEPPRAVQPAGFEQAHAHYEAGHWAAAYAAFATLADAGHREAARIALQMRLFGPRLYGQAFMAGPHQLQRWRAVLGMDAQPTAGAARAARQAAGPASAPAAARAADPAEPRETEREFWRHHGVG